MDYKDKHALGTFWGSHNMKLFYLPTKLSLWHYFKHENWSKWILGLTNVAALIFAWVYRLWSFLHNGHGFSYLANSVRYCEPHSQMLQSHPSCLLFSSRKTRRDIFSVWMMRYHIHPRLLWKTSPKGGLYQAGRFWFHLIPTLRLFLLLEFCIPWPSHFL